MGAGGRRRHVERGGHHRRDRRHLHPDRRRAGQEGQGRGALRRHPGRRGDTHQRADGDARGNAEHRRDGRADHHGHGAGGPDADGLDHGHCRRQRADQPHLHVPVDPGGRHGRGGHCEREFEHLHPGRRRPGQDPQGAGDLRRRPRPYRDAHQRGDGDGGRGSDRPPDGERCGGHVNAGLGHHLLPRGRGHRIHRDVQRPGDGDRHTEVRVQAGRGDAAGRLRERLGQRGVGVRPDGAGRRGRSQRHLVECDRARPRRRDHHADGRDDGREPDPRRAGAAGGAPGGRRPADAGLGVGAWDVAGAGLRRAARSGLDAGDGRVYGDGDGRSHHHEPGGVGGVDIRHLGDAGTGRGAGCGRDGDAGVRAAGVEPGAGRGGQRCAGVQRPVGEAGPAAAAGDRTLRRCWGWGSPRATRSWW